MSKFSKPAEKRLEGKKCPECGETFTPRVDWQIYNKDGCRIKAYWRRRFSTGNKK
jgi:uncharacterized OB-fold protein